MRIKKGNGRMAFIFYGNEDNFFERRNLDFIARGDGLRSILYYRRNYDAIFALSVYKMKDYRQNYNINLSFVYGGR